MLSVNALQLGNSPRIPQNLIDNKLDLRGVFEQIYENVLYKRHLIVLNWLHAKSKGVSDRLSLSKVPIRTFGFEVLFE